jgi:tetratricopeptide (TPR) repeat protein
LRPRGEAQGVRNEQVSALRTFRESLRLFKLGGDYIGSGRAHDRIAAALIDLGDLPEAVTHLRESLNIFEYIKDELRIAYSQYRLGWTLVTMGQNFEAIPLLRRSSETYKANNQFVNAANADTQLAHALSAIGEDDEALDLYRKTRSMYDAAGEMNSAWIADVNAAGRLLNRDAEAAIAIYRRVIAEAKADNDDFIIQASIVRLAEALCKLETEAGYHEALELLNQVSVEYWGDEIEQRSRHLNALALAYIKVGRTDDAEPLLNQVVNVGLESGFLSESAEANRLLSDIEADRGNLEKSNQLVASAIALFLAAGEDDKARSLSQKLLPTATPTPQDILRADSASQDGH